MAIGSQRSTLSIVLTVVGVIFIVGLYPLTVVWPAGFMWEPRQAEYEQMILLTFAVLGVFLLRASRNPTEHTSLIAFAAWSSLAHGLLMAWQALNDPAESANLIGDVPALILIGVVLLVLMRRNEGGAPQTKPISVETPLKEPPATEAAVDAPSSPQATVGDDRE